jgi:hypothetical protein
VVIPFVMLIYFGLAFLIDNMIELGAASLAGKEEDQLTLAESLVVAVSYVSLSSWLWLRWRREPIALDK